MTGGSLDRGLTSACPNGVENQNAIKMEIPDAHQQISVNINAVGQQPREDDQSCKDQNQSQLQNSKQKASKSAEFQHKHPDTDRARAT